MKKLLVLSLLVLFLSVSNFSLGKCCYCSIVDQNNEFFLRFSTGISSTDAKDGEDCQQFCKKQGNQFKAGIDCPECAKNEPLGLDINSTDYNTVKLMQRNGKPLSEIVCYKKNLGDKCIASSSGYNFYGKCSVDQKCIVDQHGGLMSKIACISK